VKEKPEKGKHFNSEQNALRSLREIEEEVLAEGREWTRKTAGRKIATGTDCVGGVPPQRSQSSAQGAKSECACAPAVGIVELIVWKDRMVPVDLGGFPADSDGTFKRTRK
jgi:hypothetical protein